MMVNNCQEVEAKDLIYELTAGESKKAGGDARHDVDFNLSNKDLMLSEFGIDTYSEIIVVYNFKKISKLHYSETERSN